jgi:hypothetical protein
MPIYPPPMKRNSCPVTPLEDVHRLLASPERRAVLVRLHEAATEAERVPDRTDPFSLHLDAIVDYLLTADVPGVADVSPADLRVRLHHVHLPMLGTVPGITYDAASHQIAYAPMPVTETAIRIDREFR